MSDVGYEPRTAKKKALEAGPTGDRLALDIIGLRCVIRTVKISIASVLAATLMVWSSYAMSDHVPDNLTQEPDPNYVGCMMAVEDATTEFRDALQSTCLERMGDICGGWNEVALPSQVIDCIYFEAQRAVLFLTSATPDLPDKIERKGSFGRGYQRRREDLLKHVEDFNNQNKPDKIEVAIQQSVTIFSQVIMLFWLARETDIPLDERVRAISGNH
ncbi:hypothetical protein JQT66_05750 [Sulfitobacter mediterraneus]|uniref:hypothetical protein n=1 Tax=Sulfitobacter mediterraneus TaxID=83219 RepID=UPI00193138B2|nr:hypothetical protein [Sulfitobacter mediterraneus]MBM1309662.1 hypothetical protein [Sulfitobacter mediterraneus]MBM1313547.1 hypothetical protein [Sulfitobacter mediterraneus]MBM1321931.1 hypothetical protein [Sulfitobacter mediterraneus]MBM1325818.1 hypothetical protein [Sulfitobacter mediterraneus]MBM1397164.1 hypothetical protein [Sulfitobacter mediterraneus]